METIIAIAALVALSWAALAALTWLSGAFDDAVEDVARWMRHGERR